MDLAQSILTALATAITVVVGWVGARRLGLTDIQKVTRAEEGRLTAALKDRLSLVENQNRELKDRTAQLEAENRELRQRVDDLEKTLADGIIIQVRKLAHGPADRDP